jgi:hypothetical protein
MSIKLPRLKEASCVILTACAELKPENVAFLKDLSEKEERVTKGRSGAATVYLRLLTDCVDGRHLHIDCALIDYFSGAKAPKTTDKMRDIAKILDQAMGAVVDVYASATFVLPLSQMPEKGMVGLLYGKQETVGVSMRLTAGTFTISGTPVRSIKWSVDSKKKQVRLKLEAEKQAHIVSDTYLQELLDWTASQLEVFGFKGGTGGQE